MNTNKPLYQKISKKVIDLLLSPRLVVLELGFLFVLVLLNTLEQPFIGLYLSKEKYFDSYLVFYSIKDFQIPLLPGGRLIFILLSLSITSSIFRFKLYRLNKIPLLTIHLGLLMFILGGEITYQFAIESQMAIKEGETLNYSESVRDTELVVIDRSDIKFDEVISIPHSRFDEKYEVINDSKLPFDIIVREYFPNANFQVLDENNPKPTNGFNPYLSKITHGLGKFIAVTPQPLSTDDDIVNITTIIAEVRSKKDEVNPKGEFLGVWLFSKALSTPQEIVHNNNRYEIRLRPIRYYNSYSVTLQDFLHERYVGTTVPKNFSSTIVLDDPLNREQRTVLISMNNPLRYRNQVYYQSSFGEEDTLSIFQVVQNPAWLFPYFGCAVVFFGMAWYFILMLRKYLLREAQKGNI